MAARGLLVLSALLSLASARRDAISLHAPATRLAPIETTAQKMATAVASGDLFGPSPDSFGQLLVGMVMSGEKFETAVPVMVAIGGGVIGRSSKNPRKMLAQQVKFLDKGVELPVDSKGGTARMPWEAVIGQEGARSLRFLMSGFRMTQGNSFMALFNCLLGPAHEHEHPRAVISAEAQKSVLKLRGDSEAQETGYMGLDG
uniref:Uncharacterized protein n=1 Tax=Alexandrium andersonii TaxID=327968 RepID=A0A7S2BYY2_9DINO|mmetsp:Transcript_3194/g.7228  ORF Transcript_3194/g.7228 Transcript_3194/m.7228 type:complete len:201 (+) Transcript_3194:67-669(+)